MDRKAVLAIMLTLLLSSMLTLAFNIKPVKSDWTSTQTVYIRADGSVDPSTAPISTVDNMTYILTGNITSDTDVTMHACIVLEKDNIVINGAGYALQGPGGFSKSDPLTIGIRLSEKSNVTIKNIEIHGFTYGVFLSSSSNNIVSRSNITDNYIGIAFTESSNNTISGNRITNENRGIELKVSSNYNRIYGNKVTNNVEGITMEDACSNNCVFENNVANNWDGIWLILSSTNTVSENNITTNKGRGIWIWASFSNQFYHNNIINNAIQVEFQVSNYTDSWDNGGEGNYWSDYVGIDDNSDGIGDTPYVIDENNQDNYPLMGMFYDFSLWYGMTAICNSTIYDFHAGYRMTKEGWKSSIDFNAVGPSDTTGFCRIIIPRDFMEGPYTVLVHNEEVDATELPISNSTHAFLYFNYPNSAHIKITEFPTTPPVVKATIDVDPDALNLKSKGKWISAYIELPEDYDISGIDRTTVTLNDTIPVDPFWVDKPLEFVIGDYDNDGITDLMVKFDRQVLIEYIRTEGITEAEVTLSITGKANGKSFEAADTIKVIGQ